MTPPHADWIVPDWPAPANVRSLVTTRAGGVSRGSYASLNLGATTGDDPAAVACNRERLRRYLPADPVWLRQVHGIDVIDATAVPAAPVRADAAVTRARHVVCAVLTADCVPVLLASRGGDVVAIAHAGWRGMAAGVIEATVARMGVPAGELIAWLGPGIGPRVYEVGLEVRAAFVRSSPVAAAAFAPSGERKFLADLPALARERLGRAGVTAIAGGDHCTFSDSGRFFSHRRDPVSGRFASLIWRD